MSTLTQTTINPKLLYEKLEFEPHSQDQWDYCLSDTRFNIPTCGRRWGKSIAAGHRITERMFNPDWYIWIVGPTYKLGEKEFRVVYRDFEKLGLLKRCKRSYATKQGDMRIETPWNTVLEVVSAEKPDSLVGEGLNHVCMSEAALHHRLIWEQYIEPALSDKLGTADFPSTPRGYNWYHGLWQLGNDPDMEDYRSWQLPTWSNAARYPEGLDNPEIVRIKAVASKQHFDQEYGAKFTSFVGQIYEEWNPNASITQIEYNPAWTNYWAFDYGFSNPFVCLDIMVDPAENVYVWREYYVRYRSTYEHAQLLKERENPDGFHVDCMYGDPRGANEAATIAHEIGYVSGQDVPWKHGMESIKRAMKLQQDGFPKLFVDRSCINLIRQLEQLHVDEKVMKDKVLNEHIGNGNIQHKYDDHAADALRYFFGEFFVLGAGSHLSDVYDPSHKSESDEFFTLRKNITLDTFIGF
jgi:hypothetical protein